MTQNSLIDALVQQFAQTQPGNQNASSSKAHYEAKRVKLTVSFNVQQEQALLDKVEKMQASGIEFSVWVKQQLLNFEHS